MATLPPSTDFTGSSVTQGGFKTAMSTLRTFIADLLGTDSASPSTARGLLSVPSLAEIQTQAQRRFTAGGTADAVTGTLSPAIASYTAGLRVTATPSGANTVTGPTLNLNSLGAKTIKKRDAGGTKVTLAAGDYNASGPFDFEYDGTDFILLNPIITVPSSTTDQVARDQIALTNLRLMLTSSVTTGELVQGKQWELSTDEWAANSSNETYTAGTPNYYTGAATEYTPTGSTFGDMTANGGLAAAFNGTTSQDSSVSALRASVTSAYCGKAFSSAQRISRVDTYGSNNAGYNGTNVSTTITIYGSNSSPANATDGTVLGSTTFTDGNTTDQKQITCDPSTAYQYVWATLSTASASNLYFAEIKYFTVNDVTLVPPSSTSVSTAPTYMDAYFLWKDDSGSAVLGTDLTVELSRDNGTTYTTATLTTLAAYDGTYSIVKARANVSAQPSGTSMLFRIKQLNAKLQRVAAPAIYSE